MALEAAQLPIPELNRLARDIRARIIKTSYLTQTPHLGSCLSCVDILVTAYFHSLRLDSVNPRATGRDRFILSKGHAAPALFQVLALRGFYPATRLDDYGQDGSMFAEHPPTPDHLPGLEAATGSLGHGLPIGVGMALAARIQGHDCKVVVLCGDGECNEGSTWEAAMLAAAQKLERLCVVVDVNRWQAAGRSAEVSGAGPLTDKWRAFGWSVHEVNGHDIAALVRLFSAVPDGSGKPVAIVANTVKGQGVSFMQDDNNWHDRIPNAQELAHALRELEVAS